LKEIVTPFDATNPSVKWSSSNPTIATINPISGLVYAKKTGAVQIRATAKDGSGTYGVCYITVKSSCETFNQQKPFQIYISPANHQKKYVGYDVGTCNEKMNMECVGEYLKQFLSNYCIDVYLDTTDRDEEGKGSYVGRPQEANSWMTDKNNCQYIALHSNAGANNSIHAYGTVVYYNSIGLAEELAENIESAMRNILPMGSNRSSPTQLADNTPGSTRNLGELREPYSYNIPSILIECAYHDNPVEVEFLISEQKLIAETIGNVLIDFYNIAPRK
jgi:hypothetical protein